mgnify:CR=1 FL=1
MDETSKPNEFLALAQSLLGQEAGSSLEQALQLSEKITGNASPRASVNILLRSTLRSLECWYKLESKYASGVFKAFPADVAAAIQDEDFQYETGSLPAMASLEEQDLSLICNTDETPFDFTCGVNPIAQFLKERPNLNLCSVKL